MSHPNNQILKGIFFDVFKVDVTGHDENLGTIIKYIKMQIFMFLGYLH